MKWRKDTAAFVHRPPSNATGTSTSTRVFLSSCQPSRSCASLWYHMAVLGSGDFVPELSFCMGSDSSLSLVLFRRWAVNHQPQVCLLPFQHPTKEYIPISRRVHFPLQREEKHSRFAVQRPDVPYSILSRFEGFLARLQLPLGFDHEHRIQSQGPSLTDDCGQLAFDVLYEGNIIAATSTDTRSRH